MDTLNIFSLLDLLTITMCVMLLPTPAAYGFGSGLESTDDSFGFEGGGGDQDPSVSDNGWAMNELDFQLSLHPPEITALRLHARQHVHINCSIPHDLINLHVDVNQNSTAHNATYVFHVLSQDANIAIPVRDDYGPVGNNTEQISLRIDSDSNSSNSFLVQANSVGHVLLLIRVTSFLNDWEDLYHTLQFVEYRVTVVRKRRAVDAIFDWVVAIVASLNVFSIGCATDWASLRMHFKHPTAVLLASCCQLLIMPTVSIPYCI